MDTFPPTILNAMRASGAAATCVPVQIDEGRWESALFVHVAGPECKQDRHILKKTATPVTAKLRCELMAHEHAAIVLLRLTVFTIPNDPLAFEVLLTPGEVPIHYESLRYLAQQKRLVWFFGDSDYRVLQTQEQEIEADQHQEFDQITKDAFAHDAMIRMTGRYDAEAAVAEVVSHYELRQGADPALTH